jgi:thymidylate kinase
MNGPLILIEGLDLAGKSTLFRRLVADLQQRGVAVRASRNALCPENRIAKLADELRRDPTAGFVETGALFLAAHCWDARHFHRPPAGTAHIQDSSWLRTLAFHTHNRTPAIAEALRSASASFPAFDAAIFLTASIESRRLRLAKREAEEPGGNDWQDHLVAKAPREFRALENELRRMAIEYAGAVELDTTALSIDEVFTAAWQHLAPFIPSLIP